MHFVPSGISTIVAFSRGRWGGERARKLKILGVVLRHGALESSDAELSVEVMVEDACPEAFLLPSLYVFVYLGIDSLFLV